MLPAGFAYYCEFTTANPTTGAAQNADSLPVATANRNGADDAAFSLTVANIDAGRYRMSGTVPVAYAKGDSVQVSVAATVAGVAGKSVVDNFVVGPLSTTGGVVKRYQNFTWASGGPTATGTTNALTTPTDYAITLFVLIAITGSPTAGAQFNVLYSFDGTYLHSTPAYVTPTVASNYRWAIDLPDATQFVKVNWTAQTGGTGSTLTIQLGSLVG